MAIVDVPSAEVLDVVLLVLQRKLDVPVKGTAAVGIGIGLKLEGRARLHRHDFTRC